jgi:rod shape-determining protein MreD
MPFNALIFLILIILGAADTSLFSNIFGGNVHPSALLCALIIWSSRVGYEKIWLRSAMAGLVADVFSWGMVGPGILSFSIVSALTGSLAKRFLLPRRSGRIMMMYALVIIGTAIYFFLFEIYSAAPQFFSGNSEILFSAGKFGHLGLEILINILISAVIMWPISILDPQGSSDYKIAIK